MGTGWEMTHGMTAMKVKHPKKKSMLVGLKLCVDPSDESEVEDGTEDEEVNSCEDEDEQESETEEEFERRKEAAFEEASVEYAKTMYEDLLKSRGKRWADKMKSELKHIARSKIEAEIEKRHSLVVKNSKE